MPEGNTCRGLREFKQQLRPYKLQLQHIALAFQRTILADQLRERARLVSGQAAFSRESHLVSTLMIPYVMSNLQTLATDLDAFLAPEEEDPSNSKIGSPIASFPRVNAQ